VAGGKLVAGTVTQRVTTDAVDDSELLELVAYVSGSNYRELVVTELDDEPRQPSQIADVGGVARSHISRAISELQERELVESHGQDTRATLYTLTDTGERVRTRLSTDDK